MKSKIVYDTRGRERYYIEGKEVTKKKWKRANKRVFKPGVIPQALMQTSKAWPRESVSLSVNAAQKAEAEAHARKLGVPTEYKLDSTGGACPVLTSSAHQRDLVKALGYVNRDGGYGQITG